MRMLLLLLVIAIVMVPAVYLRIFLDSTLGFPGWVSQLIATGVFFYVLYKAFQIALRRNHRKELDRLSISELRKRTFQYSPEYFSAIGEDHAPVRRFRHMLEEQDLDSLIREWPSLESEFRKLESKAGRTGRPLIMDYYDDYQVLLKYLRKRQGMATS